MAEFFTVITNAGRQAVAKATQAGVKVDITHMAIGDGGGVPVTPSENQTQLVNECWRGLVATYSQQGDSLIIDTYIPADEESFTVREMGVFTADGTLFAVCNTPEMRKVLPSEGAVGNFTLGMELDVTNIDMSYIEIHTNPMLPFINEGEKGQPDGVASLNPDGVLEIKYGGTEAKDISTARKKLKVFPSFINAFNSNLASLDNFKEDGIFLWEDKLGEIGLAGYVYELIVKEMYYDVNLGCTQYLTQVYCADKNPIVMYRSFYFSNEPQWTAWQTIATRKKQQVFELPLTEIASKSDGYAVYSKSQDGVVLLNVGLTNLSNIVSQVTVANLPVGFRPPNIIGGPVNSTLGAKGGYNIFPDGRVNLGMLEELTGGAEFSVAFVARG